MHVLPSRKEGWGLAVIEAAQHGVPTIGYRSSGGLSDSIIDGVTGVLVDDRAELVDRLEQLLADPVLRDQLGAKAQARSAEFSWPQSADAMRTVLEAVRPATLRQRRGLRTSAPASECQNSVIHYQCRAGRARRTLRGIDDQVVKAERELPERLDAPACLGFADSRNLAGVGAVAAGARTGIASRPTNTGYLTPRDQHPCRRKTPGAVFIGLGNTR